MSDKKVALVTGANKGIGQQIAKDLVGHGFTVLVGSRNLKNGEEAAAGIGPDAHGLQLDVTDSASIAAAAKRVREDFGRLDVLVNNAGISHAGPAGRSMAEAIQAGQLTNASMKEIRAVYDTNVFGVIEVTQAMLPLLREAPAGRIVIVSSSVGSLAAAADPKGAYRAMYGMYSASKTAVNGVLMGLTVDLEKTNIKVNAICPGYVATGLNAFTGHRTVEQGARHAVAMALIGEDGPTGTYSDENGPIAW